MNNEKSNLFENCNCYGITKDDFLEKIKCARKKSCLGRGFCERIENDKKQLLEVRAESRPYKLPRNRTNLKL